MGHRGGFLLRGCWGGADEILGVLIYTRTVKLPIFNKDQREGLAKIADNVATASVVAALIGGFVDRRAGLIAVLALVALALILLYVAYTLRKGDENGH
ncbi:hypothetical protein [Candidatus Contendibacter odensensis]|uniref:Uncharacterized protein n=1 Tax=Candidatus Contendobacter odensis Run_B_J11 TaxID=1400861 RepID=A0A7U7J3L7_9GAMM|nr:hypothetical protein [Candidatus Contendobacter odensis]CDH45333.1 hypothetical protein BN874_2240002 [Candidatus Contendobacter odensis Run_B_J11]